jgi:hypothetical protein
MKGSTLFLYSILMSDTEDEYNLEDYWSHLNPSPFSSSIPNIELTAIWRCPHCRYHWYEDIRIVNGRRDPCPRCSGIDGLSHMPFQRRHYIHPYSVKENLKVKHPEIARMWSSKNHIPPERYHPLSNIRVRWQCPKCKFHWKRVIYEQVRIGPICAICRK